MPARMEFKKGGREPILLALMQEFIPNQGDAWAYSLSAVGRYYDQVLAKRSTLTDELPPPHPGAFSMPPRSTRPP
jgi:maltose alpha-D-glucosyltransferase / alpha-amylase